MKRREAIQKALIGIAGLSLSGTRSFTDRAHAQDCTQNISSPNTQNFSVASTQDGPKPDHRRNEFIVGYASPLSGSIGDTIHFKVSAKGAFTVEYVRLRSNDQGVGEGSIVSYKDNPYGSPNSPCQGVLRRPSGQEWKEGCNWDTSFSLVVPKDWASGIYAARCILVIRNPKEIPEQIYDIVFIVKPKEIRGDFAVLANVNTWNAYNAWPSGEEKGFSKYHSTGPDYDCPFGSFERPAPDATSLLAIGQKNSQSYHLLRAELWLLTWLEKAGFKVDVFSDIDFHNGIEPLHEYKAVVLNTHTEYWTEKMLNNLDAYLQKGGSLLYLGGNGLFERCEYEEPHRLKFFEGRTIDTSHRFEYLWRNPRHCTNPLLKLPARPERFVLGVAYLSHCYSATFDDPNAPKTTTTDKSTRAPYMIVRADHWIFQHTGLKNTELVGNKGLLGPASGWEMDTSHAGIAETECAIVGAKFGNDRGVPPKNLVLLAVGQNKCCDDREDGDLKVHIGAHMTYYDHEGGGFVFSVGSLCFTGSLVHKEETQLQQIVKNALLGAKDKSYRAQRSARD
jgi:hypothetical protein